MSAHSITQKLSALPFPLLPPEQKSPSTLEYIAQAQEGFQSTAFTDPGLRHLEPRAAEEVRRLLFTAESEGVSAAEFREVVEFEALVHLHHGIYSPPHVKDTALLRAVSCGMLIPDGYHHRLRISRRAAAWVLGFGQAPQGSIDVDYDRNNRVHLPPRALQLCSPHQSTFKAYEALSIGGLLVTSHLRTALDLLIFDEEHDAVDLVRQILLSPDNNLSPHLLMSHVQEAPFVRQRQAVLARAKDVCTEVTLRKQGLW
ncbi:hypothetical protein [Rothia endophytica]|uniref:hypothetical protein n=1 Tax=Rothia endophytica TaxID=1324766 RepID=UPI001F1BC8C4|nr:hypothetical protein [Rothia endophytica]